MKETQNSYLHIFLVLTADRSKPLLEADGELDNHEVYSSTQCLLRAKD